ncbi:MAG: hypothetical protein KAJ22_04990 [Candidatus Izimaplasma sp.]|nr:hypothetical protein [Candidatus Izimaplasma bacterium]
MIKQSFILSFKVIAIIIAYYVLSLYIPGNYILIGVLVVSLPIIVFRIRTKGTYEYYLESLCDPAGYLNIVKKKYAKKDETVIQLYSAHAFVYMGEYEKARLAIDQVDRLNVMEYPKLILIYYIVLLKLAYNDQDLDEYKIILSELKLKEFGKSDDIHLKAFDVPLYLLEKRYEDVIELLIELIPVQKKRYLVMELEYYLALAYLEVGRKLDAIAVLEFVSNKRFHLIYNELGRQLLNEIKEPEENK